MSCLISLKMSFSRENALLLANYIPTEVKDGIVLYEEKNWEHVYPSYRSVAVLLGCLYFVVTLNKLQWPSLS